MAWPWTQAHAVCPRPVAFLNPFPPALSLLFGKYPAQAAPGGLSLLSPSLLALVSVAELSLITLHWFLTAFASVVHIKLLLRIWDLFFYEGSLVLFQTTLGMLRLKVLPGLRLQAKTGACVSGTAAVVPSSGWMWWAPGPDPSVGGHRAHPLPSISTLAQATAGVAQPRSLL